MVEPKCDSRRYLREPLYAAATNSPGSPGKSFKMSITKYGINWKKGEDGKYDPSSEISPWRHQDRNRLELFLNHLHTKVTTFLYIFTHE